MTSKVALIIVFNHRYDKNIVVLERMYKERFSHIYYLVPFYNGDRSDVIPVYENSFYFQGYLAQGLQQYFDEAYDHYFFIGDDLILNPGINEQNYTGYFNLSPDSSFIPEIFNLHNFTNNHTLRFLPVNSIGGKQKKLYWTRMMQAVTYKHWIHGAESNRELPSYSEAEAIINRHGYHVKPLSYGDVYGGLFPLSFATREKRKQAALYLYYLKSYTKKFHLSYPLVGSYSDILIVSRSSIKKFCHYCGVFAANELFVEFAIPTALLLSSAKVITEPHTGRRGEVYWTYTKPEAEGYESRMQAYGYDLEQLLQRFPADTLYIHPIKLSKWKNGTI